MHIFVKIGEGGRKTKLFKHILALFSSYFLRSLDYILFSSPNQGTRNIYGRDGKVRVAFKSRTTPLGELTMLLQTSYNLLRI